MQIFFMKTKTLIRLCRCPGRFETLLDPHSGGIFSQVGAQILCLLLAALGMEIILLFSGILANFLDSLINCKGKGLPIFLSTILLS